MFFILITDKDFREIFLKYNKYSYTVCKKTIERRMKKLDFPQDEIGDIIQISFTKLFLYMRRVDEIDNIKSLIARITELSTVNYLDKYIRDTKLFVPDYFESDDAAAVDTADPVEVILENEDYQELVTLIKTLDERYSSVLLLYYVHDIGLNEIAKMMETSENTIYSWHMRGRRLLAKKLRKKKEVEKK